MSGVEIPEDLWEKARSLRGAVNWNSNSSVETIALALLQVRNEAIAQERERAAELLSAITDVFRRCGVDSDWAALLETLAAAIRARP